MKQLLVFLITLTFFISCSTLQSNTVIKPKDSFILGNNQHGKFKVKLQNSSENDIEVYHAPLNGGKHSSEVVKPNSKISVSVDPNTALYIVNNSNDTASVRLKVKGDMQLSMGYRN